MERCYNCLRDVALSSTADEPATCHHSHSVSVALPCRPVQRWRRGIPCRPVQLWWGRGIPSRPVQWWGGSPAGLCSGGGGRWSGPTEDQATTVAMDVFQCVYRYASRGDTPLLLSCSLTAPQNGHPQPAGEAGHHCPGLCCCLLPVWRQDPRPGWLAPPLPSSLCFLHPSLCLHCRRRRRRRLIHAGARLLWRRVEQTVYITELCVLFE